MKKLLLVGLMMLAGSAWAEWVMYSQRESVTYYYDSATIRKDGNMRRVWELQDLRKRHKDGETSYRTQYEFDCKQERVRFLAASGHSEPMAGGKTLYSSGEENNWRAFAPGTIAETILKIVCAK